MNGIYRTTDFRLVGLLLTLGFPLKGTQVIIGEKSGKPMTEFHLENSNGRGMEILITDWLNDNPIRVPVRKLLANIRNLRSAIN